MLKLVEEDGDSFAKKAEMYYQKRPELISLVQNFYRMYRSLAERYDHVTRELRKNIPSDLQSPNSGMSDVSSAPSSALSSPPKQPRRRKSCKRAAGFDFFLGPPKEGYDYESSSFPDSEEESDDANSSLNNDSGFPGNVSDHPHGNARKIIELEIELRDAKEKLWLQQEEHPEDVHAKVNGYEQEVRTLNEKLKLSEEEVCVLKIEVDRLRSLESLEPDSKIKLQEEELRTTKQKLEASKKQLASVESEATESSERVQELQDQLDSAYKDIASWKAKFKSQKKESSKLLKRLQNMKTRLSDKRSLSEMSESEELKERENKIEDMNESLKGLKRERDNLNAEVGSLKREAVMRERGIEQLGWHLSELHMEHVKLSSDMEKAQKQVEGLKLRAKELEEEVERQRRQVVEGAEEKREAIRQLCVSLEHYRNDYLKLRKQVSINDLKNRSVIELIKAPV